ncbi:FadR family transcriptional regulator [Mariniphaga sediminis]|uniref:FadR family transcriptional regulator n=1 Tax=Mariniphaga sediminis TaxID=1628158 RepID=A0A399CZT5_9BACT|nr:FadR/GntR family transcriptional regulator [Mariniphaga sediminis]RIH64939.1 FadR family transcriptional regulator [Mariniphaga sediminis]
MEDLFGKIGTNQTLSQKIERRIEEVIRQKKILPGERLPSELELCQSFAVSRTALREALRRLSARGLIEVKKGSGIFVSEMKIENAIKSLSLFYDLKFDSNLVQQIIEVRRIFEPEVVKLAAINRTDKDLKILKGNLNDLSACDTDNTQREVDLINRFHLNVAKATNNPIVIISMEPVYSLVPRLRNLIFANVDGEKKFTMGLQNKIFNAIKDKNSEEAHRYAVELLSRNIEIYDKYLKGRLVS